MNSVSVLPLLLFLSSLFFLETVRGSTIRIEFGPELAVETSERIEAGPVRDACTTAVNIWNQALDQPTSQTILFNFYSDGDIQANPSLADVGIITIQTFTLTYTTVRDRMLVDGDPTGLWAMTPANASNVPINITTPATGVPGVTWTQSFLLPAPQYAALFPERSDVPEVTLEIRIRPDVLGNYDLDLTNGFDVSKKDLTALLVRTVGRGLGFGSVLDTVNSLLRVSGGSSPMYIADFTRFFTADIPNPASSLNFATQRRAFTPKGGFHSLWDGTDAWDVSSGSPYGNNVSAFWWATRDGSASKPFIGIFHTNFQPGWILPLSMADLKIFDIIGWDRNRDVAPYVLRRDFSGSTATIDAFLAYTPRCRFNRTTVVNGV